MLTDLPLPPEWLPRLDALATSHGLPPLSLKLAPALREVSDFYNTGNFHFLWTPARLAARLHFFLPRDQAKVGGALRDIQLAESWFGEGPPLQIVDIGAGIGASALGAIRALRARDVSRTIEVNLLDTDAGSLKLATEVLAGVPGVTTKVVTTPPVGVDLVLYVQVLVESHDNVSNVSNVSNAVAGLAPGGLVVIVEPALHSTTRRLMQLRDTLVANGLHVAAPCTHSGRCGMLDNPRDWCHDDLDVDLPPWLHPLARAAGLRWQGLTFARLVLTKEPVVTPPLRVVALPRDSRGRKERQLCGAFPDGTTLRWVDRLDKHTTETNAAFADLERGDGVTIEPAAGRVGPEGKVTVSA